MCLIVERENLLRIRFNPRRAENSSAGLEKRSRKEEHK